MDLGKQTMLSLLCNKVLLRDHLSTTTKLKHTVNQVYMIACNSLFAPPLSPACVPISMLAKASRVDAVLQAANKHRDSPHKYPGQACLRSLRESIKQINEAARAKL